MLNQQGKKDEPTRHDQQEDRQNASRQIFGRYLQNFLHLPSPDQRDIFIKLTRNSDDPLRSEYMIFHGFYAPKQKFCPRLLTHPHLGA